MAFTLYKELRYDLDGIPDANLTDFPKRFKIVGDADIAAECASGGGIKVTTPDGTTDLPIEVLWSETDLAAGDVEFWVKVDLLTAANVGDVIARLYYAAGETTVEDHAGVWANGYALVMHLEEDPSGTAPQMYDSVSESYIGTSAGSMTSGDLVAGKVGNGLDFDGTNDVINCGSVAAGLSALTLEFSCYVRSSTGGDWFFRQGSFTDGGWEVTITSGSNRRLTFRRDENSSDKLKEFNGGFDLNTWTSCAFTEDCTSLLSSTIEFYKNGDVQAAFSSSNGGSDKPEVLGDLIFGGSGSKILDEVRISNVIRSADWLAYAYQDDFANADTFTLGDEEGGGGPSSTFTIASDADDVSFFGTNFDVWDLSLFGAHVLYAGNVGGAGGAWLRFTGVTVPRGATINSATLKLNNDGLGNGGGTPVLLNAYTEAADNPSMPASEADAASRTLGTPIALTISTLTTGVYSIDVTAAVQEVINRPGFAGDALAVILRDRGSTATQYILFRSREEGAGVAPQLVIDYTAASSFVDNTRNYLHCILGGAL
jgi:hypothetical protein